jgi:hypothetical protein
MKLLPPGTPLRDANDHMVAALRALDQSDDPADVKLAESLQRVLKKVEIRMAYVAQIRCAGTQQAA